MSYRAIVLPLVLPLVLLVAPALLPAQAAPVPRTPAPRTPVAAATRPAPPRPARGVVRPIQANRDTSATAAPAPDPTMVARADSLLGTGRVAAAESLYYLAVRRSPRDAAARLALGRYLAARGALRIGAVLMEEARFFGLDPRTAARELAGVYERARDYRALTALPESPLTELEVQRARWLRLNAPMTRGPDSSAAPFAAGDGDAIGTVVARIGRDTVELVVDASATGLVLDPDWRRRGGFRTFGGGDGPAVTLQLTVGGMTLFNVPTRFAAGTGPRRGRVGLDVLGALAPTFDAAAATVVLRRGGRVGPALPGERLPTLTVGRATFLVAGGRVWPLGAAAMRQAAGPGRWTLDAVRGEVVAEGMR